MYTVDVKVELNIANSECNFMPDIISQVYLECLREDSLMLPVLEAQFFSSTATLNLENSVHNKSRCSENEIM